MTDTDRRFPRRVYRDGAEPDPRFSLANERTFLAWLRTGLALFAAGVAIEALELPIHPRLRLCAAGLFVLLGLIASVQAWRGWVNTERALRHNRPLPGPQAGLILAVGVGSGVVLVLVGFVL